MAVSSGRHWQGDERCRGAAGCSSVLSHRPWLRALREAPLLFGADTVSIRSHGQEGPPGLGMLSPRCRGWCWGAYHP